MTSDSKLLSLLAMLVFTVQNSTTLYFYESFKKFRSLVGKANTGEGGLNTNLVMVFSWDLAIGKNIAMTNIL